RDATVTGVQTCALPISVPSWCRAGRTPGSSLFLLAQLLQPGGDFFQSLGQGLVELRVGGLGRAAQGVSGAFARGAGRMADVVGSNAHRSYSASLVERQR